MKSLDEIKAAVNAGLRSVMDDESFSLEEGQRFSDAGLDSMDRMTLMLEVETALAMDFGEANPDKLETLEDYIAFVQSFG